LSKELESRTAQQWHDEIWSTGTATSNKQKVSVLQHCLSHLFKKLIVLPDEALVTCVDSGDGKTKFLLTNYRLIVFSGTIMNIITLNMFVSFLV
jgi:hypothetical protein